MNSYLVKLSNIEWNTDGQTVLCLPDSYSFYVDAESTDEAVDLSIDKLSDKFGFCVFSAEVDVSHRVMN